MKKYLIMLMIAMMVFPLSAKSPKQIAAEVKTTIIENLEASNMQNMEQTLKTIHTQSMAYMQTKMQISKIYDNWKLKIDLLNFEFIGMTGDYAVARFRQKTVKLSGPAFNNNISDALAVFKQENGKWKFWSQCQLAVEFIK
ncbi:MAG: hypothetical protein JXR78_03770 [Victivallales bacterium]|nr:hypothetical protein [Victivallales bacterium]